MASVQFIFPLLLVGGGIALAVGSAKANEKKKKVNDAFDLGLDDVVIDDENNPPLPPAMARAYSQNPVNRETFNAWWYQTEYPENGVMGFWLDIDIPSSGIDWLLPGAGDYADSAVVTNDGAFWVYDNGWHPADRLALEYDIWFNSGV